MRIESKISSIVANQLGRMQGALEAQILQQVNTELSKFTNTCPTPNQMQTIIRTRNSLINVINLFQQKTSVFSSYAGSIQNIVTALNAVLTIIRNLPIPTAVPPGIGVPIALTNKYAEILFNLIRFSESLQKDAESIGTLVNSVNPFLNNVRNLLNTLDTSLRNCIVDLRNEQLQIRSNTQLEIQDIIQQDQQLADTITLSNNREINLQNLRNTLNSGFDINTLTQQQINNINSIEDLLDQNQETAQSISEFDRLLSLLQQDTLNTDDTQIQQNNQVSAVNYRSRSGKDYIIEIISEVGNQTEIPLRRAVAKNNNGVIVLRGPKSFSSSTQILIDELKFRIDNQLP